ncbi:MAG: hypothetical protein HOP17_08720 [Acidobacteria bacterium]|nr:hypothetical protein [Acidobacteriota bacterium]
MQKPARQQGRNAQRAHYALAHARASAYCPKPYTYWTYMGAFAKMENDPNYQP